MKNLITPILLLGFLVGTAVHASHNSASDDIFTHITVDITSGLTTTTSEHNNEHHKHDNRRHRELKRFVDANYDQLARNAASGNGNYVAVLHEMTQHNQVMPLEKYRHTLQNQYSSLFDRKKPSEKFLAELETIVHR